MLSILRKHAGWGLKVVLSIIIVTFVFFFGYNKIRDRGRESTALLVGPEEITFSQYRFFYENQMENLKKTMKDGEIPDMLTKSIQQSTQRQLATRAMIKQFAQSLGMRVTDSELAGHITSAQDFDPVEYKNFINNFFLRNGFSYEGLIRDDLLIQKFQDWAKKLAEQPTEPPLQTNLLDIWFENFAKKTKVQSLIKPDES